MFIRRLRAAASGWSEDQASEMGAALAYYALFSLTPLLVLAITVIGALGNDADAREHILGQIAGFIDAQTAEGARSMLDSFTGTRGRVEMSLVGIGSLLFGAAGMFTSLRNSLCRIWRLPPLPEGLVAGWIRSYLLAFLMVFVSCTFLICALLVSALMPLVSHHWLEAFPSLPWSGPAIDLGVSAFLVMLLLAFTFRFMSDGRLRYRQVWSGALVSAVLFSAGKIALGRYFAYANLASVYGAAGSVVLFLAWVYYSAQILFFGAEVIRGGLPAASPKGT
jgi:membrane protein